jgi:hypothetical protein
VRTRIATVAVCIAGLLPAALAGPADAAQATGAAAAAVQATLLHFADARYADDGAAMCRLLTMPALRSLGLTGGRGSCPAYLTAFFATAAGTPPPTLAQIQARYAGALIAVNGRHADATVQLTTTLVSLVNGKQVAYSGTTTYSETLVLRRGHWLISALSATGG